MTPSVSAPRNDFGASTVRAATTPLLGINFATTARSQPEDLIRTSLRHVTSTGRLSMLRSDDLDIVERQRFMLA
jgi:hypothetical protein